MRGATLVGAHATCSLLFRPGNRMLSTPPA